MLLAILIIQCLIILLLFFHVNKNIILPNKTEDLKQTQHNYSQVLGLMSISLYKMYVEMDILDYDELATKLFETISLLNSNKELLAKWQTELLDYSNSKES